jgi:hypothetical protein
MDKRLQKLTAAALIIILFFFCLPASLLAGGYRGAALVVTLKNGAQVRGELVAVKPDSLLLLGLDAKDLSVPLGDIATVRIVKRSKAWQGLLYGFVPGAVGGAIYGATVAADEDMAALAAFFCGVVFGAAGGLVGLAAGMASGMDTELVLAGLSDAETDKVLDKLNRQAREPGVYTPGTRIQDTGEGVSKEVRYAQKWPRFRLTWLPGLRLGEAYFWKEGEVSFRFTEDLPPGEAGPYPSTFYWAETFRPTFSFGRLSLAYQWNRRLAAEIEWSALSHTADHLADLRFTSTIDGLTYVGYFGAYERTRTTSLLLGLTFRPLPPATLQPHAVEIGVAAGPAFSRTFVSEWYDYSGDRTTVDRSTDWTARARVSYDYHFAPALSMGAFAEYRWLEVDVPTHEITEMLGFQAISVSYGPTLMRTTAVTLPARTIVPGGFACGLKLSWGF